MLQTDMIPKIEPNIRVGIILPEDKINRIKLTIPAEGKYTISSAALNTTLKTDQLILQREHEKVKCAGVGIDSTWEISSSPASAIKPASGIKVLGVPAGRGFHWQKSIDVYLPGTLEASVKDGHLLLINELPLEQYLICVATAEMSACCPNAFLEAQTIAARSWMLAKVEQKHLRRYGFDVCNDDCCQRYQGTGNLTIPSIQAAEKTRGQVLLYHDRICDTRYSKSCGGMSEKFSTIWDGHDHDYLQVRPDADPAITAAISELDSEQRANDWINQTPLSFCSSSTIPEKELKKYLGNVDEEGKYFRWQVVYSQQEICSLLNEKLNLKAKSILGFVPLERGGSGRIIRLQIKYLEAAGKECTIIVQRDVEIRRALHQGFLYSSCIYFNSQTGKDKIPVKFSIHGAGWGHGVGLCQIGSLGMALQGYQVKEIVKHYYPGSQLSTIYE
jgi:stage II sporulation protein D